MNKKLLAWILLFSCNLMWALHFTSIKLTQGQLGQYFTVWFPMLLSIFMLSPFIIKDFKKNNRTFKDILVFVPLAALGAFPSQMLMTIGTRMSLASNAAIMVLILPILTAVLAYLILKEKMTRTLWISFAIAIVGVTLVSLNDLSKIDFGTEYAIGNLIIFIALIANAYFNVGCKKIADKFSGMEMVFYSYVIIVILLSPFVFYNESDIFSKFNTFTSDTWIGLILLTVFHNFLSMVLFFTALRNLNANEVGLSNYLIPFFGVPISALWLGEKLSIPAIIGGVLVLVSMLIMTIVDARNTKRNLTINNKL